MNLSVLRLILWNPLLRKVGEVEIFMEKRLSLHVRSRMRNEEA